jgi:signal transduction histidine kinase
MVHHGQTYHVYFGLNVENSYLFLFIQILDHPIQILGIAMLVSTPLCLLLAWRLTRPILQLQQSVSQLAQGNLEIQIPNLGRRDEIGQLAEHVSRMVDTLKDMIQKQKQLLSDISHELRSPLTRIQLAQALIRRKQGDSAELARIEGEIARLDKLIGDLLDPERGEEGFKRRGELQALQAHGGVCVPRQRRAREVPSSDLHRGTLAGDARREGLDASVQLRGAVDREHHAVKELDLRPQHAPRRLSRVRAPHGRGPRTAGLEHVQGDRVAVPRIDLGPVGEDERGAVRGLRHVGRIFSTRPEGISSGSGMAFAANSRAVRVASPYTLIATSVTLMGVGTV